MEEWSAQKSNIDAERSLVGSILIDTGAMALVSDMVKPEDFDDVLCRDTYAACLSIWSEHGKIDTVTVHDKIKVLDGQSNASLVNLIDLVHDTPNSVHIEQYAQIVKKWSLLRTLRRTGTEIVRLTGMSDDPDAIISEATSLLSGVSNSNGKGSLKAWAELAGGAYDEIEAAATGAKQGGIKSGLGDLDRTLGGFHKSDLIILAARPSVGKTSLALNIAEHAAKGGKTVAFFSLEMSSSQLVQRIVSGDAAIDASKIRTGTIGEAEWQSIASSFSRLNSMPLYIDDTSSIDIASIRARCQRLNGEHPIDLVVIDYLQLMGGDRRENRVQEVSEISRGLKSIARDLSVPVIALSQLSRASESRDTKEPRLSDLRESGSIEQDADVVLMLWRENERTEESRSTDGEVVNLKIAKHRNGPTGEYPLWFKKSQTRFVGMVRESAQSPVQQRLVE
jgi:replicative DNA helicase